MREFKFKCPVCGQHIKASTPQTGSAMECPTCFQRIVVPQAPESDDPKFIVSGSRYTEKISSKARTGSIKEAVAGAPSPRRGKFPVLPAVIALVLLALGAAGYLLGSKWLGPAKEFRWSADTLTGVNGVVISAWKDVAGGVNAVANRTENAPTFHLGSFNGHNSVHFSGDSRQYLLVRAVDSPMAGAGDFTIAAVFSTSTLGSPGNFSITPRSWAMMKPA